MTEGEWTRFIEELLDFLNRMRAKNAKVDVHILMGRLNQDNGELLVPKVTTQFHGFGEG